MKQALFLNGVFEAVLEEIIAAQDINPGLASYMQPYKGHVIQLLKKSKPSESDPISIYISATTSLHLVSYTAEIVGWDDKRELFKDSKRLETLRKHIRDNQPSEVDIYAYSGEDKSKLCVNLLTIRNLRKIANPFSVSNLIKQSDNKPYKPRTQAGGWSAVSELPKWIEIETSGIKERIDSDLEKRIAESSQDSSEARRKRLAAAPRKPEEIQVRSRSFNRNADVIVEVLLRADGVCESCRSSAPFIRKKDDTPYLEVHHKKNLADGGDDTTDNAIAVCPNCHREMHFGKDQVLEKRFGNRSSRAA
jgi:5-methylcytosine-specific restriction protein A